MNENAAARPTSRFYLLAWLADTLCRVPLPDGKQAVLIHSSEQLALRAMDFLVRTKSADDPPIALLRADGTVGQVVMRLNRMMADDPERERLVFILPDDPIYLDLLNEMLSPKVWDG